MQKSRGETILYRLLRESLVGMQTALKPSKRSESFQQDVLNLQRRTGISTMGHRRLCTSIPTDRKNTLIMGTGVEKCLTYSGTGNNLE